MVYHSRVDTKTGSAMRPTGSLSLVCAGEACGKTLLHSEVYTSVKSLLKMYGRDTCEYCGRALKVENAKITVKPRNE